MKRYEQGSIGMRPDPEGLWCDYTEAQAEIERLRKDVIHWREAQRSCLQAGDLMKAEIQRLHWRIGYVLSELELPQDAEEFLRETLGGQK